MRLRANGLGTAQDQIETFTYSPAGQLVAETSENAAYEWAGGTDYAETVAHNGLNQVTSLDDGSGAARSPMTPAAI